MSSKPIKIFLTGMMGSGKSHWSRRLEQYYAIPAFDLDELIERKTGKAVAQIFAEDGEEAFRALERDCLRSPDLPEGFIMACGGGTPCFHRNMDYMLQAGLVVWLDMPVDLLARRVMHERGKRPLVSQHADTASLVEKLSKIREQRFPFYDRAHLCITEPNLTAEILEAAIDQQLKLHTQASVNNQ